MSSKDNHFVGSKQIAAKPAKRSAERRQKAQPQTPLDTFVHTKLIAPDKTTRPGAARVVTHRNN